MDRPVLASGGVVLRSWVADDAEAVHQACQDPEISRWAPRIPWPYSLEDAVTFITATEPTWWAGSGAEFAVTDAATGELLGACALMHIDDSSAEIGYWVKRDARGRGVATTACRLVTTWALESLGLDHIELFASPLNR